MTDYFEIPTYSEETGEKCKSLVSDRSTEETSQKQISYEKELVSYIESREQKNLEKILKPLFTTEERKKCEVESQRISLLRPAQRLSVRQRKASAWFDSYKILQMVVRLE